MPSDAPRNPFRPGPGTWPPVLAGREGERARLRAIFEDLDARRAAPIYLLQAPRGMGKTVLLQDLQKSAPANLSIQRISAARLPDMAALPACLSPVAGRWRRFLGQITGISFSGLALQRETVARTSGYDALILALRRRRKAPLLLAVDEAHSLAADVVHVLLNVFQDLAAHQPAALLLAGTPVLKPFLLSREVNASFVERVPVIAPGLLSPLSSREALDVPDWHGWRKDDAVLEEAAADSLGYPYFLQLWGQALWDAGQGHRTLDEEALATARPQVDAVRTEFYGHRYDEFETSLETEGIRRDAMLAAVQAIAQRVCAENAAITTAQLNQLLDQAGIDLDQSGVAKAIITGNGFLTQSGDDWFAAIPSLADYIRHHPR